MTPPPSDRAAVEAIATALTDAWNAFDAAAFARAFTADAEFVNIFARQFTGRDEIAAAHDFIFTGPYRDSTNTFTVTSVRALTADVMVAHIAADLHVPQGPMQGLVRTLATATLVRDGDRWSIAAFQNTRIVPPPEL